MCDVILVSTPKVRPSGQFFVCCRNSLRCTIHLLVVLCGICLALIVAMLIVTSLTLSNTHNGEIKMDEKQSNQITWPPPSSSPLGVYKNAAVAADNGFCSEIGRNTLMAGGTVVDAAISSAICTGIMDAHSSGVGGGHFMTMFNSSTGTCTVVDSREVAPGAASENMFVNNTIASTYGYLAVGVPGEIHGLWTAYKLGGGGVPWRSLIMPTVTLLETTGIPVSEALGKAIANKEKEIRNTTNNLQIFIKPDGSLYKWGDLLKRPLLAATLTSIAQAVDPVQFFYNSSFTDRLVADIRNGGGIITKEDMMNYKARVHVSTVIYTNMPDGLTACGPPPPSSSAVTMAIINTMAGYRMLNPAQNFSTLKSTVDVYQRFVETMKFSYADRSRMGDMQFVPHAYDLARNITSESYATLVRSKIGPNAHPPSYYGGSFVKPDHGTSNIAVMDKAGNAVSLTTTINTYFGCKKRSISSGIILNNEMDDFSTPGASNYFGFAPSEANFIKAGKKPMSSMSPIVIFNNQTKKAIMSLGSAGGSSIISSTAYVAMRTLQFKEDIKTANDAPRIHNQLTPIDTKYEPEFPQAITDGLSQRGQKMVSKKHSTVLTVTMRDPKTQFIHANSDWRKGQEAITAGF